ncbi:ATP-dependent zinc metalloprotease FtsH [Psychromonas sp. psych-6C06]|uniref:ATP-dependent zinc metalloprotease FtsH n=1 Tax=Psychromonas sp. psych-6C06 TaxID=2058089 RepID=UPI000C334D62|nr:ATP-dependent zinc metalloprotease FtsH [Psychromonas sp. psych-6C06]PKF62732.1 ATP-dependent zinc metalloprotease FtsH [Psychromonas sp. psych-6C06]
MNDMAKNLILWLVIAVVLMSLFQGFGTDANKQGAMDYTTFNKEVSQGQIQQVQIDGQVIKGVKSNQSEFVTYIPAPDLDLMNYLIKNNVKVEGTAPEETSFLASIFVSWFPMLLLIGVWIFFMRNMQGGGKGGAMSFGKSKAKLMGEDQIKTTFADVAGCDEAKEDVKELVDYLKDATKFQKLGGRIPTGVLLVGPPGTGKTLLAKAIAGEAKVPFFAISGSDFVEMFVGVGASRVRDMFEQAKKSAPCIIFIDEIDAVGRQRGSGVGGGNDEREQTLNQMLVEMDGFEGNEGIIVVAATNRPDVLDAALLRPGRFDRQVVVGLPDVRGREQILNVHMRKLPLADDVKAKILARGTPGFSGADLANLANEAALFAARSNKRTITKEDFEQARDKILMGSERRSLVMREEDKESTAYHEAGHAIVAKLVPQHHPIHKVTIIPRGRALGVTQFLPEGDQISQNRQELESSISVAYGGRIAEELIYGKDKVSTGASQDIKQASAIARAMVTEWGFSEKLGPILLTAEPNSLRSNTVSHETGKLIDDEVRGFIENNYQRAYQLLTDNIDILHAMKDALMKYETIDTDQVDDLMARVEVRPPSDWTEDKPETPKAEDEAVAEEKESNAAEEIDVDKTDKE